jgi:hypothetical protein
MPGQKCADETDQEFICAQNTHTYTQTLNTQIIFAQLFNSLLSTKDHEVIPGSLHLLHREDN